MNGRVRADPDPLHLSAWARIIKSVTSLFGFVTLLVLAFATVLPVAALNDRPHFVSYIGAYVGVLLLLLVMIFVTAFTRPWLLSIDLPFGPYFPKRVATEFTDLIFPYFSNSKKAAGEQLDTLVCGLEECEEQFKTKPEQQFINDFRDELLRRGGNRIKAIPEPPSISTSRRRGS